MADKEDFEIRPITPGLGFHKRPVSLKEHVVKTSAISDAVANQTPTAPPVDLDYTPEKKTHVEIMDEIRTALEPLKDELTTSGVSMTRPLPRTKDQFQTQPEVEPEIRRSPNDIDPIADINFNIPDKTINNLEPDPSVSRSGHDGLVAPLTAISASPSAAILDGVIAMAISLLFIVALISITGIDFVGVMTTTTNESLAQISLLVLYFCVAQIYLLATRTFFGSSLGEWTFDLQLGRDEEAENVTYPIRVLLRSFYTLITGVFLLPIISLIFGKDVAGKLCGVRLFRKNY